jgi:hypothetical protein
VNVTLVHGPILSGRRSSGPIAACAVLAAACHACALVWFAQPPTIRPIGAQHGAVDVRLLAAPVAQNPPRAGETTSATPPAPLPVAATAGRAMTPAAPRRVATASAPPRELQAVAERSTLPQDADYVPRPQLSVAPQPVGVLQFDYPDFAGDAGHYRFVVSLFIDEHGDVREVRFDDAGVPAPIQYTVRNEFFSARFSPGEVDGRPVRSHIRTELRFGTATTAEP